MKNLLNLFAFLFITQFSLAQSGLKLPETNPELANEKYALLTDHYDSEEYQESYEALLWIMDHAPDMHESVYVLGQKTITKLLDETPLDSDLKESLLRVYDYRIDYFGDEVNVLNRKAFDAYKYAEVIPLFLQKQLRFLTNCTKRNRKTLKKICCIHISI